jgi:hypothetical protein
MDLKQPGGGKARGLRMPIYATDVRITTDVKLRGPEGAQRLRATSASTTS